MPQAEILRTARLDLIPLQVSHASEMAVALSDPALYTFIGGAPASVAELRSRYARMVTGSPDPTIEWLNWVIRLREGDGAAPLTGTVQTTIGPFEFGRVAEIAWVVGTPWQRRGIATEAARGLVAWLGAQRVDAVTAHIHPEHTASMAVAVAVGLAPTDRMHEGERMWQTSPPA